MKRTSALRGAVAALLLLLAGAPARADMVFAPWLSFSLPTPTQVTANNPAKGYVELKGDTTAHFHFDSSPVVLANLQTYSDASNAHPGHFADKPFSVTLFVYDGASKELGAVTFSGVVEGTLSAHDNDLAVDVTSSWTQRLHLGHHFYTVTLSHIPFTGSASAADFSQLTANVTVTNNPEPSSLVLAVLGVPLLGVTLRRRRARRKAALPV